MKRKINIQLLGLTAIAMIATLVMVVGVFYELFKREVLDDLEAYTQVLGQSSMFEQDEIDINSISQENIRITVINADGSIRFESDADTEQMDNHSKRPEVVGALQNGKGEAVRKSKTLEKNTFYYAVRLDNDTVLRVAKEADSIWSVFTSTFPVIGTLSIILFIICIGLARLMTKSLLEPIEQIAKDMEHCGSVSTYKELIPFVHTIQKQHEDILKNARMRQEFTANVSHELKTPLTAISGYAELIENGMANDGDMRRFAGEIHQNSNRLLMLINDIIRLAELDSREVEVPFGKVDLYQVAESCTNMIRINAKKHGVSLCLEGTHCEIIANKEMIEEVVFNLCDNAIRYNNKGGSVRVRVEQKGDQAILSVKDTGIGISKEHQERIFERFYRVDRSRSKSTGGTGLGLAIVKHVISKHQAEMILESEKGKGTEIKIIFKTAVELQ